MKDKNLWQYRIIHTNGMYAVHTVYFDDQGTVVDYDADPVAPCTGSIESLNHQMIHMISAFTQPVLDYNHDIQKSNDAAFDLLKGRK